MRDFPSPLPSPHSFVAGRGNQMIMLVVEVSRRGTIWIAIRASSPDKSAMPLRILIVPDKFKGTLTAHAAAGAIARGWHAARPLDTLDLLPMSDGGDGFGAVMSELLEAMVQTV